MTERRRAPRTTCDGSVCIYMNEKRAPSPPPPPPTRPDDDVCHGGIQVKCRDLSRQGIGISCNQPLQVGSEFAVVIRQPEPMVVLYGINRCSPNTRGSYDIGAQVLQVLHESETPPSPEKLSVEKQAFLRNLLSAARNNTCAIA